MKGLILSGGAGTRLRPITHTSAKQLVPIANKPILFYGIESLVDAGIEDIGLIIGETGEEVRDLVGDGARWGANITYIPQEEPLGLAHCVLIARTYLGDDDFVMYLGDNMLQQDLTAMSKKFEADRSISSTACRILLKQVQNPSSFGIAVIDESGAVVNLEEKPSEPLSDLALVGVYFFTPSIHEAVESIVPSDRGELEITDAIQWLIDQGKLVEHEILEGWWIDTGKKDPLLECNRLVLENIDRDLDSTSYVDKDSEIIGEVKIGQNSRVVNSQIEGPVIIGENVQIENSRIGPCVSIADNCKVIDSLVDDSVLLRGSAVSGAGRVTSSLLGRSAKVTDNSSSQTSILMLGDDSIVELQ